eukprot:3549450-Rhodomonas_salina.1
MNQKKTWVDVRSSAGFDTFRKERALEWLAQVSSPMSNKSAGASAFPCVAAPYKKVPLAPSQY